MSAPQFAPVDSPTADLLTLIASDERKDADYTKFLRVCQTDHECHGYVSVNRVRHALSNQYGLTIHPRTYSAMWSKATAAGGPMVTLHEWELCNDSRGRNSGKPQRKRRWVGTSP